MEKNHEILENALRQLRSFTPDESSWDKIDRKLSEGALYEGLSKLKVNEPPDFIWDAVSEELAKKEKIDLLQKITPPDFIWEKIGEELKAHSPQKSNIRKLIRVSWAAAAVIAMLLSYFIVFRVNQQTKMSYSQQIIETENVNIWKAEDIEIMSVLNQLCASNPVACASTDFKEKEKELDYLQGRKKEILNRMSAYDENKHLQIMLTKIELEKNEIVKQMISKIL